MKMTAWTMGSAVLGLALVARPAAAQGAPVIPDMTAVQQAMERAAAAARAMPDAQMAAERAAAMPIDVDMALARAAAVLETLPAALDRFPAMNGIAQAQDERAREQAERAREMAERDRDRAERQRDQESDNYDAGQEALDSARWDRAIQRFDRVIEMKGPRADAALYWKAFAQSRQGQRADALNTLAVLQKDYPKSRYLEQARALDVEMRRDSGQAVRPQDESDEDLKLLAIQALQNSDPEQAIPMLQKILQGPSSPKLKERALFVLATSSSPKARDVLVTIAKGGSGATPDVQMKAIQYLGIHGNRESRAALADIYRSTTDVDVKRRILRAFMIAGEKDRLLTVAQSEQNPELRQEAVRQLGVMGAGDELWAMYQKESSLDVKKQILQAMFTGGNADRMIDLAKGEQNPELRKIAVRNLGLMGSKRTGDALASIYASDKSPEIRKAVIQGLFLQNNAETLVAIARKESDPEMKKSIVEKLSLMHSKAATDYLLEILNK
jgi:TolA-binding protein